MILLTDVRQDNYKRAEQRLHMFLYRLSAPSPFLFLAIFFPNTTLLASQQQSWKYSFTCWSILVNQLQRLLDSKSLRRSLGANQPSCPKSGPTDLTVLTIIIITIYIFPYGHTKSINRCLIITIIGSAPSKQQRSAPEAFRAGHYKDLTKTGNRARKVSGTQGTLLRILLKKFEGVTCTRGPRTTF